MSDRVQKQKKPIAPSTARRNKLLQAILASPLAEMPSCSNCESVGFSSCEVSPINPGRCVRCVRETLSQCDVREFSVKNLERAGKQFHDHEVALEKAEEELQQQLRKIERLRKQKKMWFEKMMRAVRRGITSVEELEKVEKEEADREATRVAEDRPPSATSVSLDADFTDVWDAVYSDVPLSPSVMATWAPLLSETPVTAVDSSGGEFLVPTCFPNRRILSI
jgi:hypothetical protein